MAKAKRTKPARIVPRHVTIRGRPDHKTHSVLPSRDVYLTRCDGGACSPDFMEAGVTLDRARELAAWALSVGIRVECSPPDCLRADYVWPVPGWKPAFITTVPPRTKGE